MRLYLFYRKERQEKYAKSTKASTLGKSNGNLPQHLKIRISRKFQHTSITKTNSNNAIQDPAGLLYTWFHLNQAGTMVVFLSQKIVL